jgi:hypothetical protein
MKKRKQIILPLIGIPVCGHYVPPSILGREEGMFVYHGKRADYISTIEYTKCLKCNKNHERQLKKIAMEMDLRK